MPKIVRCNRRIFKGVAMASEVKAVFRREMNAAKAAEKQGDLAVAKYHLERAHILGQRWYSAHMESHYHMLHIALRESNWQEVRGQILRLVGAGPFHLAGWVPIGNTGGADVSPVLEMSIPADLLPYFEGYSLRKGLIIRAVAVALACVAYLIFRMR